MVRISEIESLLGLVGFRQSTITEWAILDAANIASTSGLFVNDVSGLITVKNIKQSQENTAISNSDFNTFLKSLMKASFNNLLKSVFSENDLIENRILFPYENDWVNTIENGTDFVGYEIERANNKMFNVILNSITLSFDASDSVKILLFHSSTKLPIQNKTIAVTADTEITTALGWNLSIPYGTYYIGYLRSGLTAKAYDRQYEESNVREYYNCLNVEPIKVSWDAETLLPVGNAVGDSQTWGINLDISSYYDYTNIVVNNANRFARGLQLQTAADILNLIATTTRSNRDERIIKGDALYDLNGNRSNPEIPQSVGVLNQLANEVKLIKKMFSQPKIQTNTIASNDWDRLHYRNS